MENQQDFNLTVYSYSTQYYRKWYHIQKSNIKQQQSVIIIIVVVGELRCLVRNGGSALLPPLPPRIWRSIHLGLQLLPLSFFTSPHYCPRHRPFLWLSVSALLFFSLFFLNSRLSLSLSLQRIDMFSSASWTPPTMMMTTPQCHSPPPLLCRIT